MSVNADSSFGSLSMQSMTDFSENTPSRGVSRRTSRHGSFSKSPSSPLPGTIEENNGGKDEGKISILDPRRFTPTLHANLVSEILSLRREVENKNSLVLNLEENLFSARDENVKLHDAVADNTKQNCSLKHQMEMLEGGTLSALEELAQERDTASQALVDMKKRLDASQKKLRSQEEEAEKIQALWESDKQKWDLERRNLDRKVHIVEGRLKTLLSETETSQANNSQPRERSLSRASCIRSAASHHRDSINTNDSTEVRNFRLSNIEESALGVTGAVLADELEFDDDDDDFNDHHEDGFTSPDALPEESVHRFRPFSAQSHRTSLKARKLLGLAVEDDDEQRGESLQARSSNSTEDHVEYHESIPPEHMDSSTQDSPPPSPKIPLHQALATIDEVEGGPSLEEPGVMHMNQDEANTSVQDIKSSPTTFRKVTTMVSSASQTIEQPLSPPDTPVDGHKSFPAPQLPKVVEMTSSSTQTSDEEIPSFLFTAASRSDDFKSEIPVIAIRPPSSGSARGSVVLPPRTRNASCQATISTSFRSVSIQTEEIRIDQRSIELPPHLLPSAISSNPPSPSTEIPNSKPSKTEEQKLVLRIPPPLPTKSSRRTSDVGSGDDVVLSTENEDRDVLELGLKDRYEDLSDDSFASREPIRKVLSKVQNSWKVVPQLGKLPEHDPSEPIDLSSSDPKMEADTTEELHARNAISSMSTANKSLKNSGKQEDIRRKALISSGTTAHAQRSRSPSLPTTSFIENTTSVPPFPVPDRSSSRNIPWNKYDEEGSPTRGTGNILSQSSKRKEYRKPLVKKPALRKIRSTSSTTYTESRDGSQSSPFQSPVHDAFDEGPLSFHPPLPNGVVASPYTHSARQAPGSYHVKSVPSLSGSAASDQTSVVDAIAQTMIGEWMWKYVRRRKSFGLPESAATEFENGRNEGGTNGGVRHQRWVWLAPYERAVMWSGKQPMSGSALMGKNGRKLAIQSVLDVRDDAAMPKGAAPSSCFGRSILILTPHRALKFTATSRERHYVWLTALSFLSRSNTVPPELGNIPPAMPQEKTPPPSRKSQTPSIPYAAPQTATLRRHPIRDSIRIAKGKDRPILSNGGRRSHTSPVVNTPPPPVPSIHDILIEDVEEAAEPPLVPRTTANTRKRSNTGPKSSRPSSAYRGYSNNSKPSMRSQQSLAESETPHAWVADGGPNGGISSWGRRGSDWNASSQSRDSSNNFFEAVGTMRMEAFVTENLGASGKEWEKKGGVGLGAKREGNSIVDGDGKGSGRKKGGLKGLRKKDMKYWGGGTDKVPAPVVAGRSGVGGNPFEGF